LNEFCGGIRLICNATEELTLYKPTKCVTERRVDAAFQRTDGEQHTVDALDAVQQTGVDDERGSWTSMIG